MIGSPWSSRRTKESSILRFYPIASKMFLRPLETIFSPCWKGLDWSIPVSCCLIPCGTQEPTRLFRELDTYARRNQKNADGIEIQIPDKEIVWHSLG